MVSGTGKMHKTFSARRRYFFLAALFASFTSAVMLADLFRGYESEVLVLAIPRNEISADSLGEIVSNMTRLSATDPFRAEFFDALSGKIGMFDEVPVSMRAGMAAEILSVRAEKGTSMLSIRGFSDDSDDAKTIARQAAFSLFGSTGRYYNLKEDIDLRIVTGPSVSARIIHPVLLVFFSIALGLVVTSAFFFVLFGLPELLSFFERRGRYAEGTLDTKVFEPEMPTSPFLRDTVETDREAAAAVIAEHETLPSAVLERPVEPNVSDTDASAPRNGKKASAPANLPSLSEEEERFLREFSFDESASEEPAAVTETAVSDMPMEVPSVASDSSESPVSDHEPTEEEYKRRLNQLLRG